MPHKDSEVARAYFKARRERMKAEGTWVQYKHKPGYNTEYYRQNRERILVRRRQQNAQNAEKIRLRRNEWAKKNPEKVKAQKQRLREHHSERINAEMREFVREKPDGSDLTRSQIYKRRRYAKHAETIRERERLHGMRSWRRREIIRKLEMCGQLCYICGLHLEIQKMEVDHVHPVSRGGASDLENLMPTHRTCNRKKSKAANFPVARPDLVELGKGVKELPRREQKIRGAMKDRSYIAHMKMQASR